MCSADFRHPPIVLSILPSWRILTFLKWFQGVAYTGRGSRETCPTGGAIWDDWAARKLQPLWCVLLFPHIPSMRNTYCFWWGGGGSKNLVIYEVWVKKTWGIPEGRLGTWKQPPYQEHQSWWTSWSWFTRSHVGKKKAMLTLCCSSSLKQDYSENYHQIGPGLHRHFIRKSPLFLTSKHWFPELKHSTISRRLNANHGLLLLRPDPSITNRTSKNQVLEGEKGICNSQIALNSKLVELDRESVSGQIWDDKRVCFDLLWRPSGGCKKCAENCIKNTSIICCSKAAALSGHAAFAASNNNGTTMRGQQATPQCCVTNKLAQCWDFSLSSCMNGSEPGRLIPDHICSSAFAAR